MTQVVVSALLLVSLTSRTRFVALPWDLPTWKEGGGDICGSWDPRHRVFPFQCLPVSVEAEKPWELEVGCGNFAFLPSPSLSGGGEQTETPPSCLVREK